jgi:glycerol-3-phosphate dehydrogenase
MSRKIPPSIATYPFDVIVVGAGINGAGIARDAALRGLQVLLLDKGDLAGGTTSWSTRLIHGGLRYLEHAEIGLVRESLRERERLLRLAPHLVKPLPLLIPIYRRGRRRPWMIRAGMIAYDILSLDKSLDHHHMLSRQGALDRAPGLNPDGLLGAALYFDAQVEYPERLAVENAIAARSQGAVVLAYARIDRLIVEGGDVTGVELTDLLRGGAHTARAPVTVNVTGPWVDEVLGTMGGSSPRMIGGTKGSHVVVAPFPGAPQSALYVEAREDGRPFFIIPWNDLYLIGTTDLRYRGDLDRVEADEREIRYLLNEANHVIPEAHLTRESVLFTYAGVRPLPYTKSGTEGGITRRHIVHDHGKDPGGLISIVGGKLTTYRHLAEQTVDLIFQKLGQVPPVCPTAEVPLPGATQDLPSFSRRFKEGSGLPVSTTDHLLRVYGTRALGVLELTSENADLLTPLTGRTSAIGAEVVHAFRAEMAETLTDVLMRRTMVGLSADAGLGADEAAAEIGRRHLGWDRVRAEKEVAAYRAYIRRFHPRAV